MRAKGDMAMVKETHGSGVPEADRRMAKTVKSHIFYISDRRHIWETSTDARDPHTRYKQFKSRKKQEVEEETLDDALCMFDEICRGS